MSVTAYECALLIQFTAFKYYIFLVIHIKLLRVTQINAGHPL